MRRAGALLASATRRHPGLRGRYLKILGHVLRRLGHGIDAVLLLHQRVDEAPADGGVVDLGLAGKGRVGLAHHEGRPATCSPRRRRS